VKFTSRVGHSCSIWWVHGGEATVTGVRCRGTCKDGHTTEAVAESGRVTWHGECATEGCERKVYCRRVPADTPAPPAETKVAETDPHRVLEVPGYRDEPAPAEPDDDGQQQQPGEPGGDPGSGEQPAGAGAPGATPPRRGKRTRRGPAAAPAPPVTPTPPRAERPRGVLGRLRARLGDDTHDDDNEDALFGVY
jgi:hypothetical protein